MKGFFRWFKQKTKMKRWMLLILIGILLCCYGMATVLTSINTKENTRIVGCRYR